MIDHKGPSLSFSLELGRLSCLFFIRCQNVKPFVHSVIIWYIDAPRLNAVFRIPEVPRHILSCIMTGEGGSKRTKNYV